MTEYPAPPPPKGTNWKVIIPVAIIVILICLCLVVVGILAYMGTQGKGPLAMLATATPTPTRTPSPTNTPTRTPSPTTEPTSIIGTWDLYYDWGCDGEYSGPVPITFYNDYTFAVNAGSGDPVYGTWYTYGDTLDFIFDDSPYTNYVGTIYPDGYVEGTMDNTENESGCWYSLLGSSTSDSEPMPGLAGRWEDQYETTVHTIEWDGTKYIVTDSTHPERGTYQVLEQEWDGITLTWTYRVPDGADVTLEALSVDGDELFLNWWSTNGNSGQDTFLRYP